MRADPAALPKYLALAEMLIREIAAGRLRAGDRLPPERQMAEQLGVAVGTLRKALARLRAQGVVQAVQGSGNYVTGAGKEAAVYAFFRLERPDGGGLPRARLLSLDRLAKPAALPAFGRAAEAWRIRRLRLLDDTPVAAEEIWLDAAAAPVLRAADLSESLYLTYREKLGLWIAAVEDRVGLGRVPDWSAGIGLPAGAPCGHVLRLSTDGGGERPEASLTWFNPDRAAYVARSG